MKVGNERFRRLLEPVHPRVLAFARCLCRSRADGDDLYQEAVLRALAKLDQLQDDGAFRTWLYRIVVSVHRNRCRRAFLRRLLPFDSAEPDSRQAITVDDDYRTGDWSPDAADASSRARIALATLPAVQREAIVLHEIEEFGVDEIAALQNVSSSAVKSRLARGRERLRAYYEKQFASDGVPLPGATR